MMSNLNMAQYVMSPQESVKMVQYFYTPMRIAQDYCYGEMMEYVMVSNKTTQCNMSQVLMCVKNANIYNKMDMAMFYGWKPVCG